MKRNWRWLLVGAVTLGSATFLFAADQEAPASTDPYAAGMKATQQSRQNFEVQKNMDDLAFQKAAEKPAPSPYKDAGGSEWQDNQKTMQNWNTDQNPNKDPNAKDNPDNYTQNIANPWAAPTPNTPPNNRIRPEQQDIMGPNAASNIFIPPTNGRAPEQPKQEPVNIYK